MNSTLNTATLALACTLFAGASSADEPKLMGKDSAPWKTLTEQSAAALAGEDKGAGPRKTAADLAREALEKFRELSEGDKALAPNYSPPGSPSVPSKCMENKDCKPCFEKAQAGLTKTRVNLEKVRARYKFTHRFTDLGQKVITAAGAAGGSIAALGASAENIKIDKSLDDFDNVVKNKNTELLGKLETNLQELSACEAKFYQNDDWYNRYGFIYLQFMQANYSY